MNENQGIRGQQKVCDFNKVCGFCQCEFPSFDVVCSYVKCYHWAKLGEGYGGLTCTTFVTSYESILI